MPGVDRTAAVSTMGSAVKEGKTTSAEQRDLSGDGGVLTFQKTTAEFPARPKDLCTVVVNYWVRRPSAVGEAAATAIGRREQVEYVVDDGSEERLGGIDWAVKDMGEHERRTFRMMRQYVPPVGDDGDNDAAEADEAFDVEVELVKVKRNTNVQEMTNATRIEFAERMRADGNRWFGEQSFARSFRRYSTAIDTVALDRNYTPEEKVAVKQLGLLCFLNRAQCALKLANWMQARKDTEMALKLDPRSRKARYRHGAACMQLAQWDEARRDFEQVLQAEPGNADARRGLQRVCKELKMEQQEARQVYSRAFQKPLYGDKPDKGDVATSAPSAASDGGVGDEGEMTGAASASEDGLADGEVTLQPFVWGSRLPLPAVMSVLGTGAVAAGRSWRAVDERAALAVVWMSVGTLWIGWLTAVQRGDVIASDDRRLPLSSGTLWIVGGALLGVLSVAVPKAVDAETLHTSAVTAWCLAFALTSMSALHVAGAGVMEMLGWPPAGSVGSLYRLAPLPFPLSAPAVLSLVGSAVPFACFLQQAGGWRALLKRRAAASRAGEGDDVDAPGAGGASVQPGKSREKRE